MDQVATQHPDRFEHAMPGGAAPAIDRQVVEFGSLLNDAKTTGALPSVSAQVLYEDQLAEGRLGIASSLFMALRCKHAPTAAHSLRVALGCSSWSFALELNNEECSQLEVAALLHDIGKISVPDAILLKPGTLLADELVVMDRHREASLAILRGCCSSQAILEIVRHLPAWYNGSRPDYPISGRQIPLGARMMSIVDAFDSMTTDQVYRGAMPRERALSELFSYAGTQFDPDLVELFSELHQSDQLNMRVAARWLEGLKPSDSNGLWHGTPTADQLAAFAPEALFQQKLLDNMHDAVTFVDRNGKILLWNRGAERLTGISAAAVCQQTWLPGLIGLRDEKGSPINEKTCPIASAMQTSVQSVNRFTIRGRNQRPVAVDLHAVPILSHDGVTHGAAVLLHDASPEASLEKRCQNLHERATKDPLTQVANRAEFDHTHKMFVAAHLERQLPCSLIICDIDRFKNINDTYGHQAGDEALKSFAQMLKSACRPGDLVARYGGEEFVILCADCNTATAAQRAEQMRRSISIMPQSVLDGHAITASFGVTEVQPGDTTDTMLRRADRALFEAKQRGRNMVVQLGSGTGESSERPTKLSWFQRRSPPNLILEKWMVSAVPITMAIEKIRGFVADYHADITAIEGEQIFLQIDSGRAGLLKRGTDRPVPFIVELRLTEELSENITRETQAAGRISRTRVYVAIRPRRERDRRRQNVTESAKQVAASIKSYLMASEEEAVAESSNSSVRRATNLLVPWLRNR